MFSIVTQANKNKCQSKLNLLKERYTKETGLELSDPDLDQGGMYFIGEDKTYGVIGGALIIPVEELEELDLYLNSQGYQFSGCPVITDVFFHLPSDSPLQEDGEQFVQFVEQFYQMLYKEILIFSKEQNQEVLLTFTSLDEHEDLKHFGSWPFIAQHKISSFHEAERVLGILQN